MEENTNSNQLQSTPPQLQEPKSKKKANKVLLVILVLFLIAGTGLGSYLYASQAAQKEADTAIAELQAQIDELSKKEQAEEDEKEEVNGLTIKEWGINVPVDASRANLTYKIENSPTANIAYISAVELVETSTCDETPGQIGTISRTNKPPVNIDGSARKDYVAVDDYYFVWTSIQSVCNENAELEQSYVAALAEASSGIKAEE